MCDDQPMWGELVDVSAADTQKLVDQRTRLRLSKAATARRMFECIARTGPGSRDGIALSGAGFAWATESACRRAIDDLELGRRTFKEEQYVEALLAVLGLDREEVGIKSLH
jgi:hypothetical protein